MSGNGFYRLIKKSWSDSFLSSSMRGILRRLAQRGIPALIYESTFDAPELCGNEVTHDRDDFKKRSDLTAANRWGEELVDVAETIYTRDLFRRDEGLAHLGECGRCRYE